MLNTLGAGFLEKFYENALAYELRAAGLSAYFVDLLINDVLLVELKTVKALDDAHRMQCTKYLKAIGLQLALLLDLGKSRLEIKRVAHGL